MSFWCLQISQKTNEIFVRISALVFKKRSDQKSSQNEIIQLVVESALFLFDLFLEAKAEILTKSLLVFWEI